MAETGGCCRCCFSFILTSGLTALFLWLSLRTSDPVFTIKYFYLPALNKSLTNTSIYFNLRLDNQNKDKGIYYDAVNLMFSYKPNDTGSYHTNFTIDPFYQGHKKKAKREGNVSTTGVNWEKVTNVSAVAFRVDLATAVRFKIMAWKTKRHRLKVGADMVLNDQGGLVNTKKGIKLKSSAPEQKCYAALKGILVIWSFVIFNF